MSIADASRRCSPLKRHRLRICVTLGERFHKGVLRISPGSTRDPFIPKVENSIEDTRRIVERNYFTHFGDRWKGSHGKENRKMMQHDILQ
jgi:hypothetical protein